MSEEERTCETCCWGQNHPNLDSSWLNCNLEPTTVPKRTWQFCRHWAKTRGWLPLPPSECYSDKEKGPASGGA